MKKKRFVLLVLIAMALCAMPFAVPAAADDGHVATPTPQPGFAPSLPRTFTPLDAVIEAATSILAAQKASGDGLSAPTAPSAPASVVPTPAPVRAAPEARSYPRTFSSYDGLIEYANSLASAQEASDTRLAAGTAGGGARPATLGTVFGPRVRGRL